MDEYKIQLRLPAPSQICIVVRNLQNAAHYYERLLGTGPFIFPDITYEQIMYHGKKSEGYWQMAFARWGDWEIELACPVKSPSIYEDFLLEKGEGFHHLGFDIQNLDEYMSAAEMLGIGILMSGRTHSGGFAHLDTRKVGGVVIELIERKSPRV